MATSATPLGADAAPTWCQGRLQRYQVGTLVDWHFGRNLTSKLDLTDLAKLQQKPPCRLGLDLHFNERSVYSSLSPHILCSFRVGGQSEPQRLAWG